MEWVARGPQSTFCEFFCRLESPEVSSNSGRPTAWGLDLGTITTLSPRHRVAGDNCHSTYFRGTESKQWRWSAQSWAFWSNFKVKTNLNRNIRYIYSVYIGYIYMTNNTDCLSASFQWSLLDNDTHRLVITHRQWLKQTCEWKNGIKDDRDERGVPVQQRKMK